MYLKINGISYNFSKYIKFEKNETNEVQIIIKNEFNMDNMFKDIFSLKKINMFSNSSSEITSMESSFENCENLEKISIKGFNTIKIKTMSKLFYNTKSLESLDIKEINTDNVEDMPICFLGLKFRV